MAIWLGPSSRNPGQPTRPALRRQARLVATSTWSPPPPARQPRPSGMVRRRKVSGAPAGLVCPVVTGPGPWWSGSPRSSARRCSGPGRGGGRGGGRGDGRVVEESTRPVPTRRRSRPRATPSATPPRSWSAVPAPPTVPLHRLSAGARIVAAMMQLDAPERDAPASPAVLRLPRAALLVVAGVPGAGKTTLLSRIDAPGRWSWTRSRSGPGSSAGSAGSPTGCGGRWSTPSTSCGSWSPCPALRPDRPRHRHPRLAPPAPGRPGPPLRPHRPPAPARRHRRGRPRGPAPPPPHPAPRRPSPPTGATGASSAPSSPRRGLTSVRLPDRPAANRLRRVDIPHR